LANHKSALKRIRQNIKRRERNRHARNGMRTLIKSFRTAAEGGDSEAAGETFKKAERAIRKAASNGLIPQRRADRSISRLTKTLNAVAGAEAKG
jgi:small subunit ribosomal protein S20